MSETDELMRQVEVAHDRLARQFLREDLSAVIDSTLTMQQVKLMAVLYSTGPLSGQDLAHRLGVSTPTVSGMADRLLERDMVGRSPAEHDKRVRLLALTESGEELMRTFYELGWRLGREVMTRMADEDLRALARGLTAMAEAAGQAWPAEGIGEAGPADGVGKAEPADGAGKAWPAEKAGEAGSAEDEGKTAPAEMTSGRFSR